MSRTFFKRLLMTLLLVSLCLILLIATHWGNRLAIASISRLVDGLTVELQSSHLLANPVFSRISYANTQQNIEISQLTIGWDWGCLWDSSICVDVINVERFALDIKAPPAQDSSNEPMATIVVPVPFQLKQLSVAHIAITLPDASVDIDNLSLSLSAQQSQISQLNLGIGALEFSVASNESTTPFNIETFDPSKWADTMLPPLPLAISVEQIHIGRITDKTLIQPEPLISDINLSGQFNNQQWVIKQLSATQPLLDFTLTARIDNQRYLPHQLELTANTKQSLVVAPSTFLLTSDGQMDALAIMLDSSGALKSKTSIDIDLTSSKIPLTVKSQWQGTVLAVPDNISVGAGSLELEGDREQFYYHVNGDLSSALIPKVVFFLKGTGSQRDLTFNDSELQTLSGNIGLGGSMAWGDSLSSAIAIVAEGIQPHMFWPQYQGNISGTLSTRFNLTNKAWSVGLSDLNLNGSWLDHPLSLRGEVEGQSHYKSDLGYWTINDVELSSGVNSITAGGSFDEQIRLTASITAPSLEQSVPLLRGKIVGSLAITGLVTEPHINANLDINNFAIDEHQLAIKQAILSVDTSFNKQQPMDIELTLEQVSYLKQQLQSAKLLLDGNLGNHRLTLTSTGAPWGAQLQLDGQANNVGWRGQLSSASVETPLESWQLAKPFFIDVLKQPQTISIGAHCWQQQRHISNVCLNSEFVLSPQQQRSNKATFELSDFELSQLNQFMPPQLSVSGGVSTQVSLQLKTDNKVYVHGETSVNKALLKLHYKERTIEHHFESLSSQLIIDEKLSSVNVHANSPTLGTIGLSLLTDVFATQPPLTGHIEIDKLQLAPYQALIPDVTRIEGELNVSTGFVGRFSKPLFFGEVSIKDISLATTRVPTTLTKLNSHLRLEGQSALWTSDFDLGGGLGQFNGAVDWQDKLTALLTLNGDALHIAQRKDLYVKFSPQLAVEMTPTLTKVRGDIVIDDGLIKIEDLPQSAVSLSSDVKIKTIKKEQIVPLDLDVQVVIDEALKVEAFGLVSRLAGKLNLTQTASQPLSGFGDLALVEATYKAMGQNLIINKGQLIFTGVLQNPLVNIEAVRDPSDTEDDVTAGLLINGNAKAPKLTIFSQPAMPQQEALSYLLRGKGLSSDSSGDGNNMAISMLLNSGIGQSNKFVGNIGDKLGIDKLSLNTSGSGDDTKIEVSGYITPKLQLRYGVSILDGSPEIGLRYQLTPKFFIQFVDNVGQTLDLLYKFDFD